MEFVGKITNIYHDFKTGENQITFSTKVRNVFTEVDELSDKELSVNVRRYSAPRGNRANRMFWACVKVLAEAVEQDTWATYLNLLKHYGVFTDLYIKRKDVDKCKAQWRETEVIDGTGNSEWVQVICYFGSHTYNKREFSRLINGTLQEMENLGLQLPEREDVDKALDELEQDNG